MTKPLTPTKRRQIILELYRQKPRPSKNSIAIKAGCSRAYVYQQLEKAGLYTPQAARMGRPMFD